MICGGAIVSQPQVPIATPAKTCSYATEIHGISSKPWGVTTTTTYQGGGGNPSATPLSINPVCVCIVYWSCDVLTLPRLQFISSSLRACLCRRSSRFCAPHGCAPLLTWQPRCTRSIDFECWNWNQTHGDRC